MTCMQKELRSVPCVRAASTVCDRMCRVLERVRVDQRAIRELRPPVWIAGVNVSRPDALDVRRLQRWVSSHARSRYRHTPLYRYDLALGRTDISISDAVLKSTLNKIRARIFLQSPRAI